jgi:general nucleoside transport system permease protein
MEGTLQKTSFSTWQRLFARLGGWLIFGALTIIVTIVSYAFNPAQTEAVLASSLRQATPLVLGAMCGLMGERSGVINIGIEGQMLMSAFIGFLANVYTGDLFLAVLAGIVTGAILGALLAFMSVTLKIDQIIGGTVINILALGLTGYFYTAGLTTKGKLLPIPLGPLAKIPLIGPVLFNNPPITYATIILVFVVHYVLFHTRWGLRTRAVGEHPRAADTVGINVYMMRYANVILGGAIAGLAGAFLTLEAVGSFERAMTNGRGFVALAVMIFGKWTPFGAWGAALLFGFASAMQTQLQFGGEVNIPHQFIGMLPYLLTIIVLAGFGGRARPPAADGVPYEKE